MKTYTIKPLEWDYDQWGNCTDSLRLYTVYLDKQAYDGWVIDCAKLPRITAKTRELAQNKAQELHEQELAKYLQEVE